MAKGRAEPGFVEQWLNVWPDFAAGDGWLSRQQWEVLRVPAVPEAGQVSVAVESALDGSGLAVARAVKDPDGRVVLEAAHVDSHAQMRALVEKWRGSTGEVVCGKSLMGFMEPGWQARPVTQADFAAATAGFTDGVRAGTVAHVPGPDLDAQVCSMTLKGIGSGAVLTGNRVHVARCGVWAVWAALSRKSDFLLV